MGITEILKRTETKGNPDPLRYLDVTVRAEFWYIRRIILIQILLCRYLSISISIQPFYKRIWTIDILISFEEFLRYIWYWMLSGFVKFQFKSLCNDRLQIIPVSVTQSHWLCIQSYGLFLPIGSMCRLNGDLGSIAVVQVFTFQHNHTKSNIRKIINAIFLKLVILKVVHTDCGVVLNIHLTN